MMTTYANKLNLTYFSQKLWETYLRVGASPPQNLFTLPGYLHPLEGRLLYWLAGRVPPGGLAVEVGSFKGKSSNFLAAGLANDSRLVCVDTWQCDAMPYDVPEDNFTEFRKNTAAFGQKIIPRRGKSTEVAADWQQPIDLLFIDGDHSYEGCFCDLSSWLRYVKSGGWVAFHDSWEKGVKRAIQEKFPREQRGLQLRSWSILAIRKR